MKKYLLVLATVLLVYNNSFAQAGPPVPARGFTIKWSLGYTWSGKVKSESIQNLNTDFKNPLVDAFVTMANSSDADGSYKPIHSTYGQGLNVNLKVGYMFNQYIGIDVGVSYSVSAQITATQLHYLYLPDTITGVLEPSGAYMNTQITTSARSVSVSPSVIAAYTKPKWKFYPYLRFGLSLPVWTLITQKVGIDLLNTLPYYTTPYFLGTRTDVTMTTRPKFAIGVNAAVGVVYKPSPFMGVFFELTGQYLNLQAASSTVTQWNVDGTDVTADRGPYRTQFNYAGKLSSSSNNAVNGAYNPNRPKDDVTYKIPYSNLGFNIGFQITLNKEIYQDNGPKKKAAKKAKQLEKKDIPTHQEVAPHNE